MTRLVADFENNTLGTMWKETGCGPLWGGGDYEAVGSWVSDGVQGTQGGHGSSEPRRPWGAGYAQDRWGVSGVRGSVGST